MKKGETLSEQSKRRIVTEVLSGTYTKEQARKLYGIKSKSGVLEWMRKFAGKPSKAHGLDPIPILKDMSNDSEDTFALKARISQLEEELKLSQLKGKAYQIMVAIAKEDYNLDLEKKSGAKQWKNSKK
jgi:transposase-like protein